MEIFIQIANIGLYLVIYLLFLISFFSNYWYKFGIINSKNGPNPESAVFGGLLMRAYGFSIEPTVLSTYFLSLVCWLFFIIQNLKKFVLPF